MPCYAVDPAFLPQLYHNRINPRITSLSLKSIQLPYYTALRLPRTTGSLLYLKICVNFIYICPLGQSSGILVPRYLHANRISDHSIEVRIVSGRTVEEISPQQLSVQRKRWLGFSYLLDII